MNDAERKKVLWPDMNAMYIKMYDVKSIRDYTAIFGPIEPPTRWQRISYALWRKHWYRFTDWLRDKVCRGC